MDVRAVESLSEVDPADWDALVGGDNPFVEHAFLLLLEKSGSVGAQEGLLLVDPCGLHLCRAWYA